MHAPKISIKFCKIVLPMPFAATHALVRTLSIELVTIFKRVRTADAPNKTAGPAHSVRGKDVIMRPRNL